MLRPVLPQLVEQYFRIIEEAENDAVLSSLQAIVDIYGKEIGPLALYMTDHLILAFRNFASQESENEEATFSATQSLDTLLAVLEVSLFYQNAS